MFNIRVTDFIEGKELKAKEKEAMINFFKESLAKAEENLKGTQLLLKDERNHNVKKYLNEQIEKSTEAIEGLQLLITEKEKELKEYE